MDAVRLVKILEKRTRRSKGAQYLDVFFRPLDPPGVPFKDTLTLSHPTRQRAVAIGRGKADDLANLASPQDTILVALTRGSVTGFGSVDGRWTSMTNPLQL